MVHLHHAVVHIISVGVGVPLLICHTHQAVQEVIGQAVGLPCHMGSHLVQVPFPVVDIFVELYLRFCGSALIIAQLQAVLFVIGITDRILVSISHLGK